MTGACGSERFPMPLVSPTIGVCHTVCTRGCWRIYIIGAPAHKGANVSIYRVLRIGHSQASPTPVYRIITRYHKLIDAVQSVLIAPPYIDESVSIYKYNGPKLVQLCNAYSENSNVGVLMTREGVKCLTAESISSSSSSSS